MTGGMCRQVRDAASQLEFLKEVGSAGVGSLQAPDLLYLQGLLAWKQGRDLSQVKPTPLHMCTQLHLQWQLVIHVSDQLQTDNVA